MGMEEDMKAEFSARVLDLFAEACGYQELGMMTREEVLDAFSSGVAAVLCEYYPEKEWDNLLSEISIEAGYYLDHGCKGE